MDKPDFIQRGWELRRDLHAWLKTHPDGTLIEIVAAFDQRPARTVESALRKLRADGDVVVRKRRGGTGIYRATTEQIRPVSESRKGLSMGGKQSVVKLQQLQIERKAQPKKPPAPKPAPVQAALEPAPQAVDAEPWKTPHACGDTPAGPGSRGQGGMRPRTFVNCGHRY